MATALVAPDTDAPFGGGVQRTEVPAARRDRRGRGVALLVFAVLAVLMALSVGPAPTTSFELSGPDDAVRLPAVPVRVAPFAYVAAVVLAAAGIAVLLRSVSRRVTTTALTAGLALLVAVFVAWAGTTTAGSSSIDLLGLLQNTVYLAVPLALGALGGVLCERSGVINVAIEGQLLVEAFGGALVGTVAHSPWIGSLAAVLAGAAIGAVLAVLAIRFGVNQVIIGVVLNVLALGLTSFLFNAVMQKAPDTRNLPEVFTPVAIPVLRDIPVLGPLLFQANVLVYATYVLVVVLQVTLTRTRWGLRTRAVGEYPRAADAAGIKVLRIRYVNTILGGAVAGLGGAYLTLGSAGSFSSNMTAGKGFIALAAVIFGGWRPLAAVGAGAFFAFAFALQLLLTVVNTPVPIPSEVFTMLPYLATLLAVAGLVGRVRAPAADGVPYRP